MTTLVKTATGNYVTGKKWKPVKTETGKK